MKPIRYLKPILAHLSFPQVSRLVIVAAFLLCFVNCSSAATYYSKPTATDFNNLGSWGVSTDGTGTSPASLNTSDIYYVSNNATINLTGSAGIGALFIISGSLTISNNTLTIGSIANNFSILVIDGGTLNLGATGNISIIRGKFHMASGAFNQTGGAMSVNGNSGTPSLLAGEDHFRIIGGVPNCTAGTITIVNPPYSSHAVGSTKSIFISLPAGNNYFTGTHTFILGDGASTIPGNADGFVIETYGSGRAPIQHLIVNSGNTTGRWASTSYTQSAASGTHIKGTLTINPGSEFRVNTVAATVANEWLVGSIVNNGTLTTSRASFPPVLTIGEQTSVGNVQTSASAISGSGVFRNLVSSPTAAFNNIILNNPNGINISGNIFSLGTYLGHVAKSLTLTSGEINLNAGTFVLGTGTTLPLATFTYTAGGFSNGSFKRFVAASSLTGSSTGLFPFVTNGRSRTVQISTTSNITTAGSIAVSHNAATGNATVSGVDASGSYAFNRLTNAGWTIATGDGILGGTFSLGITSESVVNLASITNEPRLMLGSGASVGTHIAPVGSISFPGAGRSGLTLTDLANTFSLGVNSSNITAVSIQSGDWNDPLTWNTGTVPLTTEAVTIDKGMTVTVNTVPCVASIVAVNGTLNINGSTLNITAPLAGEGTVVGPNGIVNINGGAMTVGTGSTRFSRFLTSVASTSKLVITSGSLTVNGNINIQPLSLFSQTGGMLTVDGNAGGVQANSVASGVALVSLNSSNLILTGGILLIVDPHISTSFSRAFEYNVTSIMYNAGAGHTLQFGNGISTDAGGTLDGFILNSAVGSGRIAVGNIIVVGSPTGLRRRVRNASEIGIVGNLTISGTTGEFNLSGSQVNISGNIVNNGILTADAAFAGGILAFQNFLSGVRTSATVTQRVSGSGVFRNLSTSPTANFYDLTINNLSDSGVIFSGTSWNSMSTTVSGNLFFIAGRMNTSGGVLTLGISAAAPGILSFSSQGGFTSGSIFKRWINVAFTDVNARLFPFLSSNGSQDRDVLLLNFTDLASPGILTVQYNEVSGTTPVSISDIYPIGIRSNSNWVVTASAGLAVSSANDAHLRFSGIGIFPASNLKAFFVTGANGPASGVSYWKEYGEAGKDSLSTAGLTQTFYPATTKLISSTAVGGPWGNASTWEDGVVPSCSDGAIIAPGATVNVNTSVANAASITIYKGGTLLVEGSSLTVGCANNNAVFVSIGALIVNGGVLTVNGQIRMEDSASFTQNGGAIIIDGNNNSGIIGNPYSVMENTALFDLWIVKGVVSFLGGELMIRDPHIGSTDYNKASVFKNLYSYNVKASPNHTLKFGDGVSTAIGGPASGFAFDNASGECGGIVVNTGPLAARNVTQVNGNHIFKGSLVVQSGTFNQNVLTTQIERDIIVGNDGIFIANGTVDLGSYSAIGTLVPQSVSVIGAGKIMNAAISPTGNFTNLRLQNLSPTGVTLNPINNLSGAPGFSGVSVTGNLSISRGVVTTSGSSALLFGSSSGTGSGVGHSGSMANGSTYAIGYSATTTFVGVWPFRDAFGDLRYVELERNGPTGAGIIGMKYTDGRGISPVSILDGTYRVTDQYNGKWDIVTFGTTPQAMDFTLSIRAHNAFGTTPLTANVRITTATGLVGNHLAGTTDPVGKRSGLTLSQLTAQSFFLGLDSADVPYVTITSGDWHNAGIWNKGALPNATSVVAIDHLHSVSVTTGAPAYAKKLSVNTQGVLSITAGSVTTATDVLNGGAIGITSGVLTAGDIFSNTSYLNISGSATVNIASAFYNSGDMNFTGGNMNVTGTGTTGINNSGRFTLAGGTITLGPLGGSYRPFISGGSAASLLVSGGTLNVNGSFDIKYGSIFEQSGGDIIVDGNAGGSNGNSVPVGKHIVYLEGSSSVTKLSGGTFTIVDPHAGQILSAYTMYCNFSDDVNASVNHTLKLGNGVSVDSSLYQNGMCIYSYNSYANLSFGNVIIQNKAVGNKNRFVNLFSNIGIRGNLTIQNDGELRANNADLFIAGNLINDGVLIANGKVHLAGFAIGMTSPSQNAQVISGTGAFRNNLHGASVNNGGFGYQVGNIITVSGGTFTSPAKFVVTSVSSGSVTSVDGYGYANYSVLPSSPAATTGGSGSGCTLYALTNFAPTANFNSLSVNNTNPSGITLAIPLSVSNELSMISGLINTTSTNLLTLGTATTAGKLRGIGSVTNRIVGPFARTFTASRVATAVYDSTTLFPVGKGASYNPIWVNPTVTSSGPIVIRSESFDANTGTLAGTGFSLSAARWEVVTTTGFGNLVNANIKMQDGLINSASRIVKANTAAGVYDIIPGVSSLYSAAEPAVRSASPIQSSTMSAAAYFAYANPLVIWAGTASSAWDNVANWCCGILPDSTTNVIIPSGLPNMPVITNAQQAANITIQAGASLTLNSATAQLSVFGNIINSGTFTHTNGKLIMAGIVAQTLPAGTYAKLEIKNAAGVTLTGSTILTDSLILTNGKLILGSHNLLLGAASYANEGSASSYIVTNGSGMLTSQNIGATGKTGMVLFPVGNSSYNPVGLTNAGTTDHFTVSVKDSVTNHYAGNVSVGNRFTTGAVNRTWIVNEAVAGGSNVTLQLSWNAANELSGFNRGASYVAHYDGTAWSNTVVSAATGSNPFYQTRSGITSFSPFGVGSGVTLPIELMSFTGNKQNQAVQLNWITASELNNSHFVLQRSVDGKTFEEVSIVKGNGTTNNVSTYTYLDVTAGSFAKAAQTEVVYYRLVQVDFDQTASVSEIVTINMGASAHTMTMSAAPNPFMDITSIQVSASKAEEATMRVMDIQGKLIFEKQYQLEEGNNRFVIEELIGVPSGVYFVNMTTPTETFVLRIAKTK